MRPDDERQKMEFLFSEFRIPTSEFFYMRLAFLRLPHSDFQILLYTFIPAPRNAQPASRKPPLSSLPLLEGV